MAFLEELEKKLSSMSKETMTEDIMKKKIDEKS